MQAEENPVFSAFDDIKKKFLQAERERFQSQNEARTTVANMKADLEARNRQNKKKSCRGERQRSNTSSVLSKFRIDDGVPKRIIDGKWQEVLVGYQYKSPRYRSKKDIAEIDDRFNQFFSKNATSDDLDALITNLFLKGFNYSELERQILSRSSEKLLEYYREGDLLAFTRFAELIPQALTYKKSRASDSVAFHVFNDSSSKNEGETFVRIVQNNFNIDDLNDGEFDRLNRYARVSLKELKRNPNPTSAGEICGNDDGDTAVTQRDRNSPPKTPRRDNHANPGAQNSIGV